MTSVEFVDAVRDKEVATYPVYPSVVPRPGEWVVVDDDRWFVTSVVHDPVEDEITVGIITESRRKTQLRELDEPPREYPDDMVRVD